MGELISVLTLLIIISSYLFSFSSTQVIKGVSSEVNNVKSKFFGAIILLMYVVFLSASYYLLYALDKIGIPYINKIHNISTILMGICMLVVFVFYFHVFKKVRKQKLLINDKDKRYKAKKGNIEKYSKKSITFQMVFSILSGVIMFGEIGNYENLRKVSIHEGLTLFIIIMIMFYVIIVSGYTSTYGVLNELKKVEIKLNNNDTINAFLIGEENNVYILKCDDTNENCVITISKDQVQLIKH